MNDSSERPGTWFRIVLSRLGTLTLLKAAGTMAFMGLFFWGYFAVLRAPWSVPFTMPLTWLDAQIPFSPHAYPFYISLWVYVSLPPALLSHLRALLVFGGWMAAMCVFCLAFFLFFPTTVPAFSVPWEAYPQMAVIRGLDASGNACPSLHVASAIFAAFWLHRLVGTCRLPRFMLFLNLAQCLLIIWSTLAIRQHVVWDVLAGTLVGVLFALLSLRQVRDSGL